MQLQNPNVRYEAEPGQCNPKHVRKSKLHTTTPQHIRYITLITFWEIGRFWLSYYRGEKKRIEWKAIKQSVVFKPTSWLIPAHIPGIVPRPELSKNCFGHLSDIVSLPEWRSKNLLLGESRADFLGEFTSLSANISGRLVGVRGEWGASFLLSLSLYALFFHLVISSCCLLTRLEIRHINSIKRGSCLRLNTSWINYPFIYLSNCAVFFSNSSIFLSFCKAGLAWVPGLAWGSSPSTTREKQNKD